MEINNLELRLSLLYSSINCHFEKFKKPEPLYKEQFSENGKRNLTITIDGGETNESEKLEALNRIILIIHNLANLKDNLKNYFKSINKDEKLVEKNIDDSIYLCIITDLSNQEKHSYPLTLRKRSNLDPKIINIENSLNINMPIGNVFYNILDAKVEISAEIVDSNDNFLFTFSELIEKTIENWENFFLKHIPNKSLEIIEKRKKDEETQNKINKTQHIVNEITKILEECSWKNIDWKELSLGMIIQNSTNEDFSGNIIGIIVDLFIDENNIPSVTLLSDFIFHKLNFHAEKYKWRYIEVKRTNDITVLSHYFHNYPLIVGNFV